MPYVDHEKQLRYQKEWIKNRRLEWLKENGPCNRCGSWDQLEVDHIDPKEKTSHRIWSWSKPKRDQELAKCRPLCHVCHKLRHKPDPPPHGTESRYSHYACRCNDCRHAHKMERRLRRAKSKQKAGVENWQIGST